MGVMKRFAAAPNQRPAVQRGPGGSVTKGGIRYGFVLDESWPDFAAKMKELQKGVRTRVGRKAVREAADRTIVPAIKRELIGITKRRARGRGVQADLTRSWAKGLKRRNIRRSRKRVGVRIYAPTRQKLERLMKGRYKAKYSGYPPAHLEFGAIRNASPRVQITTKDGTTYTRRAHSREPVRRLKPMGRAMQRARRAYLEQFRRAFMRGLRAEMNKKKRSSLKRRLKMRGVSIPRSMR